MQARQEQTSSRHSLNNIINKKYSLDERNHDNYLIKLQEFTQEGSLEIKSRKYSMQTDQAITEPSCTPAYSHNFPLKHSVSPFYFHSVQNHMNPDDPNNFRHPSVSNESTINNNILNQLIQNVEPQTIQIVEEIVIPNYRQKNKQKPDSLFKATSNQQVNQVFPVSSYNQLGIDPNFAGSFHSNHSTNSLKSSFLNTHGNISNYQTLNMQSSFSVPSYNSSIMQPQHHKESSMTIPNIQIINQQTNSEKHLNHSCSSGVQSAVSSSLPCQCTQCLQAQMAYLQSLLVQQQQLYFQQAIQQENLNESMNSQDSNQKTFLKQLNQNNIISKTVNGPIGQNRLSFADAKHSIISGSCPSHEDESIPDEILSMKSEEQLNQNIDDDTLDREQRIIRDQLELQRHYEKYIQQEQIILDPYSEENYRTKFLPELNIDPNPQLNILKKNYIELPMGEIPEMKESFYEDQSRYTNSSMSKKLHRHSVFGSQAISVNDYNIIPNQQNQQKMSNKKQSMRQSIDSYPINLNQNNSQIKKNSGSGEKEKQKLINQVDFLNDSFPILKDHSASRNKLHSRNLSQQNPTKSKESIEQIQFNQFETVITPHKSRQLSGSNWGTTINKEEFTNGNNLQNIQQSNIQQTNNHHIRNGSFNSNQKILQALDSSKQNNQFHQTTSPVVNPSSQNEQVKQAYLQSSQQQNNDYILKQITHNQQSQDFQNSMYKDITTNLQNVLCQSNTKANIYNECNSVSFDRQMQHMNLDCSSAKKDLSSSLRNQSYERDQNKTDRLINYILDQEPYYNQQNPQNSANKIRSKVPVPLKLPNVASRSNSKQRNQNCNNSLNKQIQNNSKTTEVSGKKSSSKKIRDGDYFYPVSIAHFNSVEKNDNIQTYQQITQDSSALSPNNEIKQQLLNLDTQNDSQYDQVSRVFQPLQKNQQQMIVLKTNNQSSLKEGRSRSVEPRNGRIFQKYSALKNAQQTIKKPRKIFQQKYSNDQEPNSARWSSVPAYQRQYPLLLSQQHISNAKNSQESQIFQQPPIQMISQQKRVPLKQIDSQNQVNRLAYSGQRGKNQKQSTQKSIRKSTVKEQTNEKQTNAQQNSKQTIFDRLASQGTYSRKSRIEDSIKNQNANQPQNQLFTVTQNSIYSQKQILKVSNQSKKYTKTLFEMSELPSLENIQRSISVKRQQNQLIVSIAKRKSSVQSNNGCEISYQPNIELYNLIKNKEYQDNIQNRRSIQNVKNKIFADSLKKNKVQANVTEKKKTSNIQNTYQAYSARQAKSSSMKRQDISSGKSQKSRLNLGSTRREPKHFVIQINKDNKKTLFSQSVEKPSRPLNQSRSPLKAQKNPIKLSNQKNQNQRAVETPKLNYYQADNPRHGMETPKVREIKYSNPSIIQTQNSMPNEYSQSKQSQKVTYSNTQNATNKSERASIYKNPFQNSNLASYRESFLVPSQNYQHQKQLSYASQSHQQAFDQQAYNANLYQQIISSQVLDKEDEIEDEYLIEKAEHDSQIIQEESCNQNEIEFIISDQQKSLNMNEINDIKQSADIHNKISEYYKLKEQQERNIQDLQERQAQLQRLQMKEQKSKDLNFILNQLENTERSRVSTVQGFASFNTLEQQEFLSFSSVNNPYQMPRSLLNTIDKQQSNQQQSSSAYQQKGTAMLAEQVNNYFRQLDSGINLIQTPISKDVSAFQSDKIKLNSSQRDDVVLCKTSSSNQNEERRVIYQSLTSKRKSINSTVQNQQMNSQTQQSKSSFHSDKQPKIPNSSFCLPNALFFKKDAVTNSSESVCNVGTRSAALTSSHVSQRSNKFSRVINDCAAQSGSDVEVLRQSTDNSPQILGQKINYDTTNKTILNLSINNKNESSVIIKSFGVDAPPLKQIVEFNSSSQRNNFSQNPMTTVHNLNQSMQNNNNKVQKQQQVNKKPNIPPPQNKHYESMKISNANSRQVLMQMTPSRTQISPAPSQSDTKSKFKKENQSAENDLQNLLKNQSQKSSNSQLSHYKADDEHTQNQFNQSILQSTGKKQSRSDSKNSSGDRSQFRTLKLSQNEKEILRERVEQHRKSLRGQENV